MWGCIKDPVDYQGRRGPQQAEPFTEILAKNLKLNYADYGRRGASNWDIYNSLMTMGVSKADLVIVSWSGTSRKNLYYDMDYYSPSMWLDAILNTTAHLDNIGCEYYYLSSFQDYRLSAPKPVPEHCTRNWLWYDDLYPTLYDLCMKSKGASDVRQGEFVHNKKYSGSRISDETYKYMSERFVKASPYITGCHHPSQLGHELLAGLLQDWLCLPDK